MNIFFSNRYDLYYVVENANWSTDWDGKNITQTVNKLNVIRCKITSTHIGLRNKIIHFGSVSTFINKKGIKSVHKSNKVILTWFHIALDDARLAFIPKLNEQTMIVHTSAIITKNKLISLGLNESHVVVVPLGVDLEYFTPISEHQKMINRNLLGIPQDVLVVGSFQKDGNGWGDGISPKLIKGPDIFCDVIEKLSKKYSLHVLLTGPARGYVKNRLAVANIPFSHSFLSNFYNIIPFYQSLDLYLVCSRAEGGPKAILESIACGVPVVSTRVGMASEIIENGKNGYVVDEVDSDYIYEKADLLLSNEYLRKEISRNGIEKIKKYDLTHIANLYWEKIYFPIHKK